MMRLVVIYRFFLDSLSIPTLAIFFLKDSCVPFQPASCLGEDKM